MLRNFLIRLVSKLYDWKRVPSSFLEVVTDKPGIIIVTQARSWIIEAMLRSFAKRAGFESLTHCSTPPTERSSIALNWLSVTEEDLLQQILETDPQSYFSTCNLIPGRGPQKNAVRHKFGIFSALLLLLGSRYLLITFGKAIQLRAETSTTRRQVSRQLKLDFYRNMKLVRGAPFQRIDLQMRSILSGPEFEREIKIIATRMNLSEDYVRRLAQSEFLRMAANPRAPLYWIGAAICRFLLARLFSQVLTAGVDELRESVKAHTVVLVPMHRSHLDYVLLGYKLFEASLNPPIVAAGINLSFWPFGFFIRSLGGYFVKRNARNDRIHAMLLRRYVTYLVKHGHLQEFFIEGGRSRSGRMAHPKVGLLSTMISAYMRGVRKELLFVPVSITYENVMEDEVFGDENTGRSKTKENLFSLLRARDLFGKKYGDVLIRFGQAIPLSRFVQARLNRLEVRPSDERNIVTSLAYTLTRKIREQSDISLTSLTCLSLISAAGYGRSKAQLQHHISTLCSIAKLISPTINFTPSLNQFLDGHTDMIRDLERGGMLATKQCLGEEVYYIPGKKRFVADFYKNSCVHIFVNCAFASLIRLSSTDDPQTQLMAWYDIFKHDFILNDFEPFKEEYSQILKRLADHAIINEESAVAFTINPESSAFMPEILLGQLETLMWIYRNLDTGIDLDKREGLNGSLGSCDYAEFINTLQTSYKTAMYLGHFGRTEASSYSALNSALDSLRSRSVIGIEENSEGSRLHLLSRDEKYRKLIDEAHQLVRKWQISKETVVGFPNSSQNWIFRRAG